MLLLLIIRFLVWEFAELKVYAIVVVDATVPGDAGVDDADSTVSGLLLLMLRSLLMLTQRSIMFLLLLPAVYGHCY